MTEFELKEEGSVTRNMKIVFLVSMFIVTTFFCFLPKILMHFASKKDISSMDRQQIRKMRRRKRLHKSLLSLTNCFASGVFLGVCLLDVLPEVEENFENFFKAFPDLNKDFPTPQFCVVVGFLVLITIEQMANLCRKGKDFHGHNHPGGPESLVSSTASTIPPSRIDYEALIDHHNHQHQLHEHPGHHAVEEHYETKSLTGSVHAHEGYGSTPNDPVVSFADGATDLEAEIEEAEKVAEDLREEEIERREVPTDPRAHSQVRYVMLAVALSIHSIFEGLALGLMDKLSSVVQLFAAIAIHKCIVAFSFGVNMAQSELSRSVQVATMMIFCLASPVGTGVGLGIEMVQFNEGIAGAVIGSLQGLACGSFLYIVFFELLPHEFFTHKRRPSPLLKVLALSFGIFFMTAVMMIAPV